MAESSICMKETLVPGVAMISTVTAIMLEHPSLYFQTSILILLQNELQKEILIFEIH